MLAVGRPAQVVFKSLVVGELCDGSAIGGDGVNLGVAGSLKTMGDRTGGEGDGAAVAIDLDGVDGEGTARNDSRAFGQRLLIGRGRWRYGAGLWRRSRRRWNGDAEEQVATIARAVARDVLPIAFLGVGFVLRKRLQDGEI